MSCERTRALSAELALGIADGADRAEALRHLAECADCRRELDQLTAVADELLLLAPAVEPPAGFESRVLAAMHPPPTAAAPRRVQRLRRVLAPVAAAAVAAAVAAGIVLHATSDDRRLAAPYRGTLAAAHRSSFEAARLLGPRPGHAGAVYRLRAGPPAVFLGRSPPCR